MYELNYKTYKAGFWYYFKFESMLSDTMIAILYSLPAFFLKFFRIFAKNLSEKKQLESDFLRLQINPHFLVNALNNIYSLVVIEDQRSPGAILSLSNLLNYVLYESSLPTVSLEKEITFLQDFVSLEKIRSSSKTQVNMKVEGETNGKIAPLILIAFIENAFKHGSGDATLKSYININIKVEDNTFFLGVVNSKVRTESKKQKKSLGGIGLTNVHKRLASLYPDRHSLQVIPESSKYSISLVIQLT
jgi:LytS/YehU family sensor histidine kinase